MRWAADEEESFGRTLERGTQMLADLIRHAHEDRTSWIDAEDAFRLHDTYGFPYDLTKELLAEQGLSVDDEGFEELMEEQRVAGADGNGDRARLRGPPRRRAQLRVGGAAVALRRLREAAAPRPACWPPRATTGAPWSSWRRAPSMRRAAARSRTRARSAGRAAVPGSPTSTGSGTTRRSSSTARSTASRPGPGSRRRWTTSPASPRCATTRRPTCSTRRSGSGSAPTCARRARRCGPTSSASTSPTAPR